MLQSLRIMLKSEQQSTHCYDPAKVTAQPHIDLHIAPTGALSFSLPGRTLCVPAGHFFFRVPCYSPGRPSRTIKAQRRLGRRPYENTEDETQPFAEARG